MYRCQVDEYPQPAAFDTAPRQQSLRGDAEHRDRPVDPRRRGVGEAVHRGAPHGPRRDGRATPKPTRPRAQPADRNAAVVPRAHPGGPTVEMEGEEKTLEQNVALELTPLKNNKRKEVVKGKK